MNCSFISNLNAQFQTSNNLRIFCPSQCLFQQYASQSLVPESLLHHNKDLTNMANSLMEISCDADKTGNLTILKSQQVKLITGSSLMLNE